ncbi:restriction endonuclease [Stenotrophomonas sp. C4297]|jgi:hypothetical protein|uniref:restriction endonuclease n=1 Tax=Stenotrophomonas sp. C4297 TaxID=3077847 RepID=UPI00293C6E6C|nr:restriction endonuclease [Stenotrophomonas sp. C4297]MDV3509940.1 restriction endonuclease [Stenotrophomonas sp. C4297]HEL4831692.1 restriction endonuclease [Stenotrophomonas maltophilia]HEL4834343.1 restriction endonuclease [Stenotrophomonas maltophilia]
MNHKNKDGKAYESMVHFVYSSLCKDEKLTSVAMNVLLAGPDGDRQIDVLVKHTHAGIQYVTAIECRDYAAKLTVSHVDAFASVVTDIKASRGVLVSRKGFSKTAIQKANRLGIGLCVVDNADAVLKGLVVQVPLIVKVVHPTLEARTLVASRDTARKISNSAWTTINDVPLRQLVIKELRDGRIEHPDASMVMKWSPQDLAPPFFIRDAFGVPVEVVQFDVTLHLNVWYLFGHTDNLPDAITQTEVGGAVCNVFMPDRFKAGINESFSRYEDRAEIPIRDNNALIGVYTPDEDGSVTSSLSTYQLEGVL